MTFSSCVSWVCGITIGDRLVGHQSKRRLQRLLHNLDHFVHSELGDPPLLLMLTGRQLLSFSEHLEVANAQQSIVETYVSDPSLVGIQRHLLCSPEVVALYNDTDDTEDTDGVRRRDDDDTEDIDCARPR